VEPSSIVDDLRRRDFTLNAMAASLRPEHFGKLLDPFGGRRDLERKVLRVLHPLSFIEDPTRIFRAVRFEERYRFRMDSDTEALARAAVEKDAFSSISPERLLRELRRVFSEPRSVGALLRLEELGVLRWLHPDLALDPGFIQLLPAAIQWWRNLGERANVELVMLAGLLLSLDAKTAADVAENRLRLPVPELAVLAQALDADARIGVLLNEGTNAALYRRLNPLSGEAICLLRARTLQLGKDAQPLRERLERYAGALRSVRLEIGGSDLKSAGVAAGPAMGKALQETLDAKLNGLIHGRDEELKYALERLLPAGSLKDA
jgi:tRNA nucleotidyltransferase (CCA-adding enzyme)